MSKSKKKININEATQVNGKIETQTRKPSTLDEVWGDVGVGKYGTLKIEEYERRLDSMNSADLRAHAATMGFMPHRDVVRLKKKLLLEFTKHTLALTEKPAVKNLVKPDEIALKIMSDVK